MIRPALPALACVLGTFVAAQDSRPAVASAPDDLHLTVLPLPAASRASLTDHRPRAHVLADSEYYTWGGSAIRGADGDYHLFYARWPRGLGFSAWLTHSQVARAVADRPAGPYRYVQTVLTARGPGHWDRTTAHNAKIKRFGDRFYLYYTSTDGEVPESEHVRVARERPQEEWMVLRNAQRTGVAWADALTGPWERCAAPIVQPARPISKLTVNPAVARGPDGTWFMIIKGDKPGSRQRNQALATADAPTGPFAIQPEPVIDSFDTEDASMWYDGKRKRFYAVYHAHTYIGMLTSADGYRWEPAQQPRLLTKEIRFDDGSSWKPDRVERPFVMLGEDGQPAVLFVAAKRGDDAVNLALSLSEGPVDTPGTAGGFRWVRPAHWKPGGDASMRLASFAPAGQPDVEVYVVVLPGTAGGVAANINRWRAQMGADPLSEAQIEALPRIDVMGDKAILVEIEGSFRGMGGAAKDDFMMFGLVVQLQDQAVFVKMTGPAGVLPTEREHFIEFCKSLARSR